MLNSFYSNIARFARLILFNFYLKIWNVIHLFYASDLEKTHQHLDENEFLEIVRIPISEIDIFSFEDSKTIIALSYLNMKNKIK